MVISSRVDLDFQRACPPPRRLNHRPGRRGRWFSLFA